MAYNISRLTGKGNATKVNHDQLFKHFFSIPQLSKELLQLVLSPEEQQELFLEDICSEKDSFESKRADLIFSVPMRVDSLHLVKLYFLIEHKSYYDPGFLEQVLDYQYLARKLLIRQRVRQPFVVPVVFYHGPKKDVAKWKRTLQENDFRNAGIGSGCLFDKIRHTLLNCGIAFIDIQDPWVLCFVVEHDFQNRGIIILLNRVSNTYKLPVQEAIAIIRDDFASLFKVQNEAEIDKSVLWISSYLKDSGNYQIRDWKKVEEALIECGVLKRSLMEITKYYMDLGRQEGLQEGRREERQQLVVNMLKEKADIAFIAKVTGLSEKEVQQVERCTGLSS